MLAPVDLATAQVLFELATLTFAALLVGLGVFALVRRRRQEIGWQYHGNVWTEPYDVFDLVAALLVAGYFFLQVAGMLYLAKDPGENAPEIGAGTAIVSATFTIAFAAGVFCVASVLRDRSPVQLFGLDRLPPLKVLGWAAGTLVAAYFFMAVVVFGIWEPFLKDAWGKEGDVQDVVEAMMRSSDPLLRGILLFTAIVVAPVTEEIIFRGYLYAVFKRFSDRFFAAIVTSLLFAAVHGNVPGTLPLFVLAILLTVSYELTGCLWVPIVVHATFNLISSLAILSGAGT